MKRGYYYGLFGTLGSHRRYLHTYSRKDWELFKGYGGDAQWAVEIWSRRYDMADVSIKFSRGVGRKVYIVGSFPMVLPIRGCGNDC